jgi:hypothetical protein
MSGAIPALLHSPSRCAQRQLFDFLALYVIELRVEAFQMQFFITKILITFVIYK